MWNGKHKDLNWEIYMLHQPLVYCYQNTLGIHGAGGNAKTLLKLTPPLTTLILCAWLAHVIPRQCFFQASKLYQTRTLL